ncbi:MAG TPA: hypothetical protein VF384_16530 [Planctomycetota bacterium]
MLDEEDAAAAAAVHCGMQLSHAGQHRLVGCATQVLDFGQQDGRLSRVSVLVTILCIAGCQQLLVVPTPVEVGQEVAVRAELERQPLPGLAITVRGAGTSRPVGVTGPDGQVRFVPEAPGDFVAAAEIGGVETLAPFAVVPERRRWLIAVGCVPLGLALLWRNLSRARGRRGS